MTLKPIREQAVCVFGASSGIGRAAALRFARKGARLMVAARDRQGLDSLVEEIRRDGGVAIAETADASDFDQVKAVADRAAAEFGRLDTWVHCAAVSLYATLEETTPEEFRRVVDVNLTGSAFAAMAAIPHLRRAGGGAFLCISSVEARRALPYQAAYAASKHGIKGMLDALRLELEAGGDRIAVTNIMPAGINTPFFNKARTKLGVKPMPMPPIYQPESVADVILYAAEHPVNDIYAGGAAKFFSLGQTLSPRATEAYLRRSGFEGQKTAEPRSETAPDNLFEPIPGYGRVRGDFDHQARRLSVYNWLGTHPRARNAALAGGVIGAIGLIAASRRRAA